MVLSMFLTRMFLNTLIPAYQKSFMILNVSLGIGKRIDIFQTLDQTTNKIN